MRFLCNIIPVIIVVWFYILTVVLVCVVKGIPFHHFWSNKEERKSSEIIQSTRSITLWWNCEYFWNLNQKVSMGVTDRIGPVSIMTALIQLYELRDALSVDSHQVANTITSATCAQKLSIYVLCNFTVHVHLARSCHIKPFLKHFTAWTHDDRIWILFMRNLIELDES